MRIALRTLSLFVAIWFAFGPVPALACQWRPFDSPNPGDLGNDLFSISADSTTDAWAVGTSGFQSFPYPYSQGETYHYDGTSWSLVVATSFFGSEALGVSALSPDFVWVVGYYQNSLDPDFNDAFAVRWDGSAWSGSKIERLGPWLPANFNAVAAIGPDDAWTVGFRDTLHGQQQLVEHWNGRAWRIVDTPIFWRGGSDLIAVSAIDRTHVYALGTFFNGAGRTAR